MEQVSSRVYQSLNRRVIDVVPAGTETLLDVGCGGGAHAEFLATHGIVVDGVTLSPAEAEMAAKVCRKVWIHDLEQGLPQEVSGPYDVALCSHVLEHIRDPDRVLADIWKVIGENGYAVVALPNLLEYKTRWRLFRGKLNYTSDGILDSTHVRWYTWATGPELFRSAGFRVEKQIADGGFPLPVIRKILGRNISSKIDQLAGRLLPGLFGWQHIYLLRRAASRT